MKKYLINVIFSFFSVLASCCLYAEIEVEGAGINAEGHVVIEFGQVPAGAKENRSIRLCPNGLIPDIDHASFNIESQQFDGECVAVTLSFTPEWKDCDYASYETSVEQAQQTFILKGIGVAPPVWEESHFGINLRFAGAIDTPAAPYSIATAANGDSLVSLGRETPLTTDSFSHIQLRDSGGFGASECHIPFNLDQLNEETKISLAPFRGVNATSGIATVSALASGQNYYVAAQTSGFYLSYQAGENRTCDVQMNTFGNGTRMDFIDFFSALSFGGSPRFCQDGPCLSANGLDCNLDNQAFLDDCSAQLGDERTVVCSTESCNFQPPSKAGSIAVTPGGLCSILTNTRGNEIETLVFKPGDRTRSDREHFSMLGDISLAGKAPKFVDINSSGRMVLINKQTAVICQVEENFDSRACSFNECREVCHESFKNAAGVSIFDNDGAFLVADRAEERAQLFSSNGEYLSSWPDMRLDNSQNCGLTEVTTYPESNLAALLYQNSDTVVILERQSNAFRELFTFNSGTLDSLDGPVSADITRHNDDANLYVASEGSSKILRFQRWPHDPEVNFRLNLPPELSFGTPPDAGNGACLIHRPQTCRTTSSFANEVCTQNNIAAIIGGIIGGGFGTIATITLFIVVAIVGVKYYGEHSYSPGGTQLEMKP